MPATDKLIQGYERFRKGYYQQHKELLSTLAREGQSPKICIISCCDSRVDTSIILDTAPGDLFVIRNVANLVPPCETDNGLHGTSAALEFAVTGLEVESIVILGHTQCGGIRSLIEAEPQEKNSFISNWMQPLTPIRKEIMNNPSFLSQDMRCRACEQYGILYSMKNLTSFPWIKKRVEAGTLKLHGWYYDINSAELFTLNQENKQFEKVI